MQYIDLGNLKTVGVEIERERKEAIISVRTTEEGEYFLFVGDEKIKIADYKAQISADREAEICVTIKGKSAAAELLTELETHTYVFKESSSGSEEQTGVIHNQERH